MALKRQDITVLERIHRLPDGLPVRLRLARAGDQRLLELLLERLGVEASPLEVRRVLRYDPRRRVVVCASALIGKTETLVGLGAVDLTDPDAEPDTLVFDRRLAPELGTLLRDGLRGRLSSRTRDSAA